MISIYLSVYIYITYLYIMYIYIYIYCVILILTGGLRSILCVSWSSCGSADIPDSLYQFLMSFKNISQLSFHLLYSYNRQGSK